jgi:pimeloyl-ACP methyl ester carboxylesterase
LISTTFFVVRKEMSLARLDWTQRNEVIASGAHWRLRDYAGDDRARPLLIIAAPIKRPYIWDLAPSISTIRFCLRRGLSIQLLEWMPASSRAGNNGLDEYTLAISEAVATIATAAQGAKPFLIGHSLGGTLAAIYAAFLPESIRGLVLLGAPLCFEPSANQFRDALVTLVPREICDTDPFPGSLLSHASALASPRTFIWSRLMDAAMSSADPLAMEIHARVERWALDEVPLPGKLVHQIINLLYRENRFCQRHFEDWGKGYRPFQSVGPNTGGRQYRRRDCPSEFNQAFRGCNAEKRPGHWIPWRTWCLLTTSRHSGGTSRTSPCMAGNRILAEVFIKRHGKG